MPNNHNEETAFEKHWNVKEISPFNSGYIYIYIYIYICEGNNLNMRCKY